MKKKLDIKKQDLLEIIYEKILKFGKARLTDVALKLNFSKSRTSQEVKKLKKMGFLVKDKYGPLKLTNLGKIEAKNVSLKHKIIKNYLKLILKVNDEIAERDACAMEHVLTNETINAILKKLKKMNKFNFKNFEEFFFEEFFLDKLKENQKAKIIEIQSDKKSKKILMERGIIKGEIIQLVRKAPFGDPLEYKINDYKFSLRKKDAEKIKIMRIKK